MYLDVDDVQCFFVLALAGRILDEGTNSKKNNNNKTQKGMRLVAVAFLNGGGRHCCRVMVVVVVVVVVVVFGSRAVYTQTQRQHLVTERM